MVEIVKVYRQSLPALTLVGKRYTDADRDGSGGYGAKWGQWFQNGWFDVLEKLGSLDVEDGAAYLGCMRCGSEGFEYWIGMFMPLGTAVPDGFGSADIPAGDVGICWLRGREDNGEVYGEVPHNMSMAKFSEQGWKFQDDPWFFERYTCPRFTSPDAEGKIVLDYGIYLK